MQTSHGSKTIWFVILTYHPSLELLARNIALLQKHAVVVVDNTTQPEEKESLKKLLGNNGAQIYNDTNLGYAAAMNKGIDHALAQGAEWVVLLNDDLHFTEKTILSLVQQLREPAIVGPFVGTLDKNRWTTILHKKSHVPVVKARTVPTEYVSGSCIAIHKTVIKEIGKLYEPYFLYYEDVDFCIRAHRKDIPVYRIELPEITHTDGTSIIRGSRNHQYYLARNHLLFVSRQAPVAVRFYEFLRFPLTVMEHIRVKSTGGFWGCVDFVMQKFGKNERI